jgi:hypothetical protein
MRTLSTIASLAVAAQALVCCSTATAELMLFKIRTAEQCPEGLTIKTKQVEGVLRWRWPAAGIAAILLVPLALLLSVACTVAWQHGFPPLF